MRINRKFKGSKAKDNKGYLKSNEDNFTPYKDIDGGDITMKGVDRQLIAIPMDKDGNPIGMKFMKPGGEYEFGGATNTIEIPTYKKGGKSDWISNKVATLIKEGKPQSQAVAIAYDMYDKKMYGGEMQFMQGAGMVGPGYEIPLAGDLGSTDRFNIGAFPAQLEDIGSLGEFSYGQSAPGDAPTTAENFNGIQGPNMPAKVPGKPNNLVPKSLQTPTTGRMNTAADNQVPSIMQGPEPKVEDRAMPFQVNETQAPQQTAVTAAAAPINSTPKSTSTTDVNPISTYFDEEMAALDAEDMAKFSSNLPKGNTEFARTKEADFEAINKNQARRDSMDNTAVESEKAKEEDYQFFNPYQGVDIPTAANLFGQGIGKGGDPKMAVAAGAKLALGLGRNIVSGMGRAKSNQFALEEDRKKRRESAIGQDPIIALQEGGELTAQDRSTIREEAGFDFNDEYINEVFSKVQPVKKPESYSPNLGRYKDVNYFGNAKVQGNKINLETTKRFPGNIDTMNQYVKHIKQANPGYDVDIQYIPKSKFREDSKYNDLPDRTRMADNKFEEAPEFEDGGNVESEGLLTGNYSAESDQGQPNVEVEVNEYIQTPKGELTKVMGETHEKGGAKMNLEEGTKIVSDHLKVKGPQARQLKKEFDVEVSAKDTYAKAIDKFYKKSGLQDIIDEKTQVIKTIKAQQEKLAQDKGKGEATTNINLEFLSGKLNDLGKAEEPLMAAANMFFNKIYDLQESTKPEAEADRQYKVGGQVYNTDQIISLGKKYNLSPEQALGTIKKLQGGGGPDSDPNDYQNLSRLQDFTKAMQVRGYTGPKYNPESEYTPEQLDALATKLQDFAVKNAPDDIVKYFTSPDSQVTLTAKGVGKLLLKNPGLAKEAGVPKKTNPADYSEEERRAIKSVAADKDLLSKDFILEQFKDQKWAYRAPVFGATGEMKTSGYDSRVGATGDASDIPLEGPAGTPRTSATTEVQGENLGEQAPTKPGRGVYLSPDQELLPPTGMVPSTKIERRYGRMDAERYTPDQQLAELNRSVDAAMSQLSTLPSGQQEAAIVQLQANKQQQTDKIISDVEKANKQLAQQEQAFNIRQGDREVDANAVDTLSFEQRSLGAMANTEDDFRRYFNEGQRRNVEKFKEIESMNLMNALYENFDITPDGIENTVSSGMTNEDLLNALKFQQGVAAGTPTTGTTTKKARGGRVRYKRK